MAAYDPPQPLWKRNLAGILDFLLVFFVLGFSLSKVFGNQPHQQVNISGATTTEVFAVSGWSAMLLLVLIVIYFVVGGRTGGTVFQRLFRMKRPGDAGVSLG
jgi:hypothetical protein